MIRPLQRGLLFGLLHIGIAATDAPLPSTGGDLVRYGLLALVLAGLSILLPLPEFSTGLTCLKGEPHRPVVLVCRTDKRSTAAARRMTAGGWWQISVLRGGMEAWQRAGLLVEH